MNKKNPDKGIKRIWRALGYAIEGFRAALAHEASFRNELLLSAIAIPFLFWLRPGALATALMLSSLLLILMAELANSAIESIVDRISLEQHTLSKRAKDMGGAMVLMAFINAACIWGLILIG